MSEILASDAFLSADRLDKMIVFAPILSKSKGLSRFQK
jgi:hypothetical protein